MSNVEENNIGRFWAHCKSKQRFFKFLFFILKEVGNEKNGGLGREGVEC
jgi:hypothetical protein